MVRRGLDQIQSWMGWLVGWLSSIPPSFPFDRECYYERKNPARTFNKRAISASQEGLLYPRQTKQNKSSKRYGMVPCIRS